MRVVVLISILLCSATHFAGAQNPALGPLRVSENRRFLTTREGKPFFWMGDTAWELLHRLSYDEAKYYFSIRQKQGFTVIQTVALAELDGINTPNAIGLRPINDATSDALVPNPKYFDFVERMVDLASDYGLYIALLPAWGDKVFKNSWGAGPEIFTTKNARSFGKWMGSRFAGKANLIWILGGDRNPRDGSEDVGLWRAMAEGVEEGAGKEVLMSFHPQPTDLERGGSSQWFHNDTWLDFNMLQNGHCRETNTYDKIARVYQKLPVKPVIDAEPLYEGHPVCFDAARNGTSTARDVRYYAYLDVFAGAFGHTYGAHAVWQMYDVDRKPVNGPNSTWKQALELPGAVQMQYLSTLMESRPMLDRVPDQTLIRESNLASKERIQATRGVDYAFVFSYAGKPFTVLPGKIRGSEVHAAWFNPRNGKLSAAGIFDNSKEQVYFPPVVPGEDPDWVLVLDGKN